jgi:hypothetical protein
MGSQPFGDHVPLNEKIFFGVPPILDFMQLRTTKTTFFPQKIQNKQNLGPVCVPPVVPVPQVGNPCYRLFKNTC